MNVIAIIPSKNRKTLFEKKCLPFVETLGIPYVVALEEEDYYSYNTPYKIKLPKKNQGLGYALKVLKKYALEHNYDVVWKMDDDISTFTNDIAPSIPGLLEAFDKYPALGGIAFPYKQEFYNQSKTLFNKINYRLQTSYLIRTHLYDPQPHVRTFEDFWQFLNLRLKNHYTLLCGKHSIVCSKVGEGAGGQQHFDRKKMAIQEIEFFRKKYPPLKVKIKKNKPWYYEPIMSGGILKAKSL